MLNINKFWAEYEDLIEEDYNWIDELSLDNVNEVLIVGSKRGKLSNKLVKKSLDIYALEEEEEYIRIHYRRLNEKERKRTYLIHGYLTYFNLNRKFSTIIFYEDLFRIKYEEIYNFFKMLNIHLEEDGEIILIKDKELEEGKREYQHPFRKTKIIEENKIIVENCIEVEEKTVEEYDKDLLLNKVDKKIIKFIISKEDLITIFNRNGYKRIGESRSYYIIKRESHNEGI